MPLPTKANTTRPLGDGYGALIEYGDQASESLYLPLAVAPNRQLGLATVEPNDARGPDTSANPEDMRAESGASFSRSAFTGGEGLDRAHRRNGVDRDWSRFWDSRNIDVTPARAGAFAEVKLLHSTSSLRAMAAGANRGALVRIGTVLYGIVASATQVDRTADPTATTPAWTQESPGGTGDIDDLAALGDELYAARGEIRKRSSGGAWAAWSDLAATRIWNAKERIIASDGAGLYEARSAATSVLLHTLPAGQVWNDVVDAGSSILAAASDGLIYAFTEEDANLVLRSQQPIAVGEVPTALAYVQGLIFVGTSQPTTGGGKIGRLWRSVIVGLRLRDGEVLREWGDGTETRDRSPQRIIVTREAVWTGVIEDGSETHLWRYHLSTGGMVRDLVMGASGAVHGLVAIDDRMFANIWVSALYRENTTFATSGYLIGPLGDFFNAATKTWVGARMQTGDMPVSTQVILAYSTDPAALEDSAHASWTNVITATPAVPAASVETAITEVESRYITGKVTLTPNGANTATPVVLAFSFRGMRDITEDEVTIPINISDRFEKPGRKALHILGSGDARYEQVDSLKGQAITLTLLHPAKVYKGQLRSISAPIDHISERGSPTVYALITVRGQKQ